jgi:hypothetical protein
VPPSPVRAIAALVVAIAAAAAGGCHSGGSEKAFCEKVGGVPEFAQVLDSFDPTDAAAAKKAFDDAVSKLDALERASPGEIRADVATVADVARKVADELEKVDDPVAPADRLDQIRTELESVAAPSLRVAAYARDHCGILLLPSTTSSTAPGTPTPTPPAGGGTTSTTG